MDGTFSNKKNINISLNKISKGTYYINVIKGEIKETQKIIID